MALALPALAQDPEMEKRVTALATELRCLVCQNQTLADSNAPLAVDAKPDPRATEKRQERAGRDRLHGRALRRLRALSAAIQGDDDRALGRPVCLSRAGRLAPGAAAATTHRARARAIGCRASARGEASGMTVFWLVGAALAAVVVFHLLRSRSAAAISRREANIAIYRDQLRELDGDLKSGLLAQADYERARRELEARLLDDAGATPVPQRRASGRRLAWTLGAGIPLLGLCIYLVVGTPSALSPREDPHSITAQQLEGMVERLAARLRENPDDVEGWKLLGRSYTVLGRFAESAEAYAKAAARAPRDAQLLADLADVLAMARGQSLEGEPEKLVLRALEIDPANLKALALAGTAAFARKDYSRAAAHWEKMLAHVAPDSEDARAIRANVQEARSLAGLGRRELKVTVCLSPKLKDQAQADDTVFVFARAAEGPAMPLAVKRVKVRELPASFALDDSMAMAPGMNLSAHPRVVVVARVSRSGGATPQPGDLQGATTPVANDASGVNVVIDSVVR